MKKLTALLSALAILVTMACGCGSNPPDAVSSDQEAVTTSDSGTETGENETSSEAPVDPDTSQEDASGEVSATESGTPAGQPSTNPGKTSSNKTNPSGSQAGSTANVNKTGFPITKDAVTLTFMTLKSAYHGDFANMLFTQEYEKKTNVKINWLIVSDSEVNAKKQLTLASRDYPDAMFMGDAITSTDIVKYGQAGVLIPINDLLADYAPNLKKLIDTNAEVRKSVTATDGKIYSLPSVTTAYTADVFTSKVFINNDWLTALNMEKPKTYADLLKVLRAFKKNDPNKNGRQDEIPLVIDMFNPGLCGSPQGLHWNWLNDCMGVDKNGKIKFAFGCDEFNESLRFFRTLADEKLMDERVFRGQTSTAAVTNTSLDNVGMFITQHGALALPESKINKFESCQPIQGDTGSAITPTAYQSMYHPFWGVITVANSNVGVTLRWLDYFYTTEGFIFKEYGPSGTNVIKKMPSGKYQVLLKGSTDKFKYAPGWVLPGLQTKEVFDSFTDKATTTTAEAWYKKIDVQQVLPAYQKYMPDNYIPSVFFSLADANKLQSYREGVINYAKATAMSFVYRDGELNLDTGWNTYITELKKLGMDEMVKCYQDAYNKYLKN